MNNQLTYEQAINQIENITRQLQDNKVPLEESIRLFEDGINLINFCNQQLSQIESSIAQIVCANGSMQDFSLPEDQSNNSNFGGPVNNQNFNNGYNNGFNNGGF